MNDFISKISLRFSEEADRFIFERLQPYCERITSMEITKEHLANALCKSKPMPVHVEFDKDNFPSQYFCPRCGKKFGFCPDLMNYCSDCGQALEWGDEKY